jgi:hypothetical protein
LEEFQTGIYQNGKLVSQVDEKNYNFFYPPTFFGVCCDQSLVHLTYTPRASTNERSKVLFLVEIRIDNLKLKKKKKKKKKEKDKIKNRQF